MLNDKNVTDAINSLQLASIVADFRIVDGVLIGRLNLQCDRVQQVGEGPPFRSTVIKGTLEELEVELRQMAKKQRRVAIDDAKRKKAEIQREIEALESIADEPV